MKKIGLVTNKDLPNLSQDDQLLFNHLLKLNYDVEPVVWNRQCEWKEYDLLIVRSVWDYHLNQEKFQDWLAKMASEKVKVWNEIPLITKNLHKFYLAELIDAGLNVIPTKFVIKNQNIELSELIEYAKGADLIVKPAVSLNSHDTYLITNNKIHTKGFLLKDLSSKHDLLIQPFIPGIRKGELSLIYFNRKFSHAISKIPAKNDFRVQSEFGGIVESVTLPSDIIEQASQFLKYVDGPLLYARIDGVILNDSFYLMELELIDPLLFFSYFPASLDAFASAMQNIGRK